MYSRRIMLLMFALIAVIMVSACRMTPIDHPALEQSFTIVALPDTQHYVDNPLHAAIFDAQTKWIVENLRSSWLMEHLGSERIVFVTHLGDLVQNNGGASDANGVEWERAVRALSALDGDLTKQPDGLVPYSVCLGNHDYEDPYQPHVSAKRYVEFFGAERYQLRSWYVGSSPDQRNHAQTFEAGGHQFLHLNLEYRPTDDDLIWAGRIIEKYPGLPTIVSTHAYLDNGIPSIVDEDGLNRGNSGQGVFEKLVKPNAQIFMVLNGHFPEPSSRRIAVNDAGLQVIEMESDYQNQPNGGNGWLRLITFDLDKNIIAVRTYSPTLGQFRTNVDDEFSIPIDFNERFMFTYPLKRHGGS